MVERTTVISCFCFVFFFFYCCSLGSANAYEGCHLAKWVSISWTENAVILYNPLSMGTCFSKSKCADLGRSFWTGACTTCLQMRSTSPPVASALSHSRALDSVWLCLGHFRFRSCVWLPSSQPGSEQKLPPRPPTAIPTPGGLSSTCRARITMLCQTSLPYFCLSSLEIPHSCLQAQAGLGGRDLDVLERLSKSLRDTA